MRKTQRVRLGAAAIMSLALMTACSDGENATNSGGTQDGFEPVTLTYASFLTEDTSNSQSFESWAEMVTERTDGAVTFESTYNGALCGAGEIATCIANGTADIGFSSTGYEVSMFPISSVALTGYMTNDLQATSHAFSDLYEETEAIREEWEEAGVRPIYNQTPGPNIVGTSGEVESLSDLNNLSLRTSGDAGITLQLLGVNPVSMDLAEAYEGIERGVIDGISTSVEGFVDARLYEVASNLYDIGEYIGNGQMFHTMISQSVWEALDQEVQAIMMEAADEVESSFMDDFYQPMAEGQCEELASAGATVSEIGPESDGSAWADEAQALQISEWLSRNDGVEEAQAIFDRYEELVAEHEQEGTFSQETYCIETTG